GNSVTAPKVFSINVDGVLDESDWDISQPVAKLVDGTVVGDQNEIFFGVTYNEEFLYVGIDVTDAGLVGTEIGEVFVDGNNSGGDYDENDCHLRFSALGIEVIQGPEGMEPLIGFVVKQAFDGFTAEVGIAWADLGVTPVEGEQIGFDILMGDDDTGTGIEYTLAWNGGMENYETTSLFGALNFGVLSCGCISLYNETTGDVVLRNPTDMPTKYVGTYELDADYNMVFRKDMQATVHWGSADFPSGIAVLDGDEIPATIGRFRVTFDCLSGEYSFVPEPSGDVVAYAQFTEDPVTIDGNLSEYTLDYGSDIMATTGGTNNNTVTWGTLWDMQSFYVGVKVVDAVVEGSGNPWDNDAIEFYIDGNHDEDGPYDADFDTQLILDFVGQSELWIKADGVPITNYESNWTATADGYNVELRIGWDNIDFYAGRNRSIGWSLGNNDSDNGLGRDYQTVWVGTGNNWSNTDDLGDLQLAGGPYYGIHDVVYYNAQFVLYPNPSNGTTYLRTMGDIFDGQVSIFVTDLSGRTVVSQTERLFGSNDIITLKTNDLQAGLYLINIMGADGKKAVKKLIIQ
ncbi:MAG: T9SS type A sorting domain-containing protein, partial [Bacteroidales bacterium]|nr:T9SS type A sorting domain-containing protein [Bacteroidales bacterium]